MHPNPTPSPGANDPRRAYGVMRAIRALERLAIEPHSAPELGEAIGVDARTARRMLDRLRTEGYVVQGPGRRRRYRLTLRLAALGSHAGTTSTLTRAAAPALADLARELDRTVAIWAPGPAGPVPMLSAGQGEPVGDDHEGDRLAGIVLDHPRRAHAYFSVGTTAHAVTTIMDRGAAVAALTLSGHLDETATGVLARAAAVIERARDDRRA